MNEETTLCTRFPGEGMREKKEMWIDRVPPGWMPSTNEGLLAPSGIPVWIPALPLTILKQREEAISKDVQQSLQTQQRKLPSRNQRLPASESKQSFSNVLSQF